MLDPIVAIRNTIVLEPDETGAIHVVTGVAETREARRALIEKYHDRHLADRVFELAWTHSQVVLRQLDATEADTQLYGRLASTMHLRQPVAARRREHVIARNRRGQSGLWGYGISGDLPIVLLRIADRAQHRARAAARPGARVLAAQGPGRRSGDLERGPRPATARCCTTRSWA